MKSTVQRRSFVTKGGIKVLKPKKSMGGAPLTILYSPSPGVDSTLEKKDRWE